jgi:hypothetical protein
MYSGKGCGDSGRGGGVGQKAGGAVSTSTWDTRVVACYVVRCTVRGTEGSGSGAEASSLRRGGPAHRWRRSGSARVRPCSLRTAIHGGQPPERRHRRACCRVMGCTGFVDRPQRGLLQFLSSGSASARRWGLSATRRTTRDTGHSDARRQIADGGRQTSRDARRATTTLTSPGEADNRSTPRLPDGLAGTVGARVAGDRAERRPTTWRMTRDAPEARR